MLSIKIGILLLCLSMTEASLKITRSSRDGRHPKALELEMSLPENGKSVRIPLSRTDAFESMPVTVMQNGVSRTFSARQLHHDSHAHYNDIESKAVISVRDVDGHKQFSGHFMHEGRSYFVEPIGKSHNVRAEPITPQQLQQHQEMQKMQKSLSRKRRQTNNAATDNIIEVAVCLDSTVYNKFHAINGSSALTEIHYYYTHIMNGVDMTFRNIPGSQTFSVRSVSLTVSQTAGDDAWMPSASTANRNQGSVILESLKAYKQAMSSQPDHVMAFTTIDIVGSSGSSSVIGMAYLSGVCKNIGVSINEDNGMHSWGVAAHELGHNMGSNHDGSTDECSSASQNIMAPSSSSYTLSTVANSYRFSTCSCNQIGQYAESLGTSSCMKSNIGSQNSDLAQSGSLGARVSLDLMCKLSKYNNPGKVFITSTMSTSPATICAQVFCTTGEGSGQSAGGMRAPAGTPCGSRKSCNWNGECTDDTNAPVLDESCFWGDTGDSSYCTTWLGYFNDYNLDKAHYCPQLKPCCKTLATKCSGYMN